MGDELRIDQWVDGSQGITLGSGSAASPATHIYNGDQRALLIGSEIDPTVASTNPGYNTYLWSATSWAIDGTLTGGVVQANFNDVIVGSVDNDSINGLGGNDALDGGLGNDNLDGGAGNDLIAGGAGSDIIFGDTGNDMILSATGLDVAQRTGPGEVWQVPSGKTLWIKGSNWGVADANGIYNYTISGGESLTPDTDPDSIFAGAGDDRVIGGLGDDYMDGGLNNDLLDGGAGADTIIGDGKHDVLFGGIGNVTFIGRAGAEHLTGGAGMPCLQQVPELCKATNNCNWKAAA